MTVRHRLWPTALLACLLCLALSAAALAKQPAGPRLVGDTFITADGTRLPLRAWGPAKSPNAVIVAVHGFNDYSNFFDRPGRWLARRGIRSYAFDQRGFGKAPDRGLWAGGDVMANDLEALVRAVGRRHPGVPVHVLGHSMGGAVVILFAARESPAANAGIILVAPAVWGRDTMPWYQVLALEIASTLMPAHRFTGRGLNITPSDNMEMLRALARDPLILKGARADALAGVTNLMDQALAAAPRLKPPALILQGLKDEVIPAEPVERFIAQLPAERGFRVVRYNNAYHMMLRDLNAEIVYRDILAWIRNTSRPLPSGADRGALGLMR